MSIVTRERWGAREPRAVNRITTPTRHLVLHYFDADWPGPEGTRRCQDLHMGKGWWDIAYSLTADADNVYIARGPGVRGAHTPGWNDRAHAVGAQVSDGPQPDGLLDRLAEAAVWLYDQGAVTEPAYTGGHRDYSSTACPGSWLYARIPEINERAARLEGDMTDEQAQLLAEVHRQLTAGTWEHTPGPYDGSARTVRDRVWQTAQITIGPILDQIRQIVREEAGAGSADQVAERVVARLAEKLG